MDFKFYRRFDIIQFIMQKKQLPPQPPFNPFMFPFPFPYPPPPFINPMMNLPPKVNPNHGQEQLYPPHGPPMPPFGFPPFPMMYPPPPEAFFRFQEQRNVQKKQLDQNVQQQPKERKEVREEVKKKAGGQLKIDQKKISEIIVLSDDDGGVPQVKPVQLLQKKCVDNKINIPNTLNQFIKPRRTERKVIPSLKPDPFIKKTRIIQKKRQPKIIKQKQDNQSFDAKQAKFTPPTTSETNHEHFNRSTRIKYLTIKQGKGKIMLGDQFQAVVPPFLSKDQSYTIWLADVKTKLISRFQKDGL